MTAVMRRLLATQLIVILLAPWIAALSGAAAPVVPCPMHRSGETANHAHANGMTSEHQAGAEVRDSHLWLLMNLELWAREYLDQRMAA